MTAFLLMEAKKMEQIKRGEIYYANLCPIVGLEQGGIRPVVILQNDKNHTYKRHPYKKNFGIEIIRVLYKEYLFITLIHCIKG